MNAPPHKQNDKDLPRHDDAFLQEYFEICRRIYEQMESDGTWPWESDSPNSENLIDSEDKSNNS